MDQSNWPCIIPARSGSKRIPGKNMLKLGSGTLLGICIQKAIESKVFSDIIVSTDSSIYQEYAISCGAKTYGLRPASLSGDRSSTKDLILYFLNEVLPGTTEGFTLLQCTSPFTTIKTIQNVTNISREARGSCISVKEIKNVYIEWMYKNVDGKLRSLVESDDYLRSQDCNPALVPTGNIYSSTKDHFLKHKSFLNTDKSLFYKVIDDNEVLDIDTRDDYRAAIRVVSQCN